MFPTGVPDYLTNKAEYLGKDLFTLRSSSTDFPQITVVALLKRKSE